MKEWLKAFAPASVGNAGPGFDILGFAIKGIGDIVEVRQINKKEVRIIEIEGDNGQLPKNPQENTAGIAAIETLKKLNINRGVELKLTKNMPLQSGTGSSGTSAAAAAYAVNFLFGNTLSKKELIEPCIIAEAAVSGYHADNVAASLLGGFVLIKGYKPLDIIHLGYVNNLFCVLATPEISVPTKLAREVLPESIPMKDYIHNAGHAAAIVVGVLRKDIKLIGRSIEDVVIEPARAHLIPGFYDVKQAAIEAGAVGCSISGAGPSMFAICDDKTNLPKIGENMRQAFEKNEVTCRILLTEVDKQGAKLVT